MWAIVQFIVTRCDSIDIPVFLVGPVVIFSVCLQRYHEKKRQSGTSGDKVRRAKAGQGVVELEELLRKDRPRFDPASLLDSVSLSFFCLCCRFVLD